MKKKSLLAGVAMGAMVMATAVSGCGKAEPVEVTITFMNEDAEVGSITTTAGAVVEGYESYETIDGYEFLGWFEAPTYVEISQKDLTVDTFEEDTVLYGYFKPMEAAEDTRNWYIVGAGTSKVLADGNWAGVNDDAVKEAAQMTLTGAARNEFAITLDLYAGDQFQLIPDWSWDGQLGYGYFTEIDAAQMENGGGLSGSDSTSNVNVLMDGNYTITLTTNPDNMKQTTISVVRNGDVVGEE